MSVCTYDNPETMCRECWQDGKMIESYAAVLFFLPDPIPAEHFFFGANVGPWETGRMVGDSLAIAMGVEND